MYPALRYFLCVFARGSAVFISWSISGLAFNLLQYSVCQKNLKTSEPSKEQLILMNNYIFLRRTLPMPKALAILDDNFVKEILEMYYPPMVYVFILVMNVTPQPKVLTQ